MVPEARRLRVKRLPLSILARRLRRQARHEHELAGREADGQEGGDEEGQVRGVRGGEGGQVLEVHDHEGRQESLEGAEERDAVDGRAEQRRRQHRLHVRDDGAVGHGGARGARVMGGCARAQEARRAGEGESVDGEADDDGGGLDAVEGVEEVVPRRVGEEGERDEVDV